jgi:hypothetical protein
MKSLPTTSAVRKRMNFLETIMVGIYLVLTAYISTSNRPPSIDLMFHEAVRPFQIRARARRAGAERSAAVWRLPQSEARLRWRYAVVTNLPNHPTFFAADR